MIPHKLIVFSFCMSLLDCTLASYEINKTMWQDLTSTFGAFLDPVADKLMVATVLILLSTQPVPSGPFKGNTWIIPVLAAGSVPHKSLRLEAERLFNMYHDFLMHAPWSSEKCSFLLITLKLYCSNNREGDINVCFARVGSLFGKHSVQCGCSKLLGKVEDSCAGWILDMLCSNFPRLCLAHVTSFTQTLWRCCLQMASLTLMLLASSGSSGLLYDAAGSTGLPLLLLAAFLTAASLVDYLRGVWKYL
jgi:phosphatidylglycerophosphate synthase